MKAGLVSQALLMALWKRKPAEGLLWHTDRGSQYASASHCKILKDHAIKQRMSRKGNCWDIAVSESFFHTLKTELVHHMQFKTRVEAKSSIFEFIEVFYNRVRMHSANDYLSPVEYEQVYKSNELIVRKCVDTSIIFIEQRRTQPSAQSITDISFSLRINDTLNQAHFLFKATNSRRHIIISEGQIPQHVSMRYGL